MENIYKIKIKTNPDPRGLYPSERRYSASIVLGLGVVHICLALTAMLMASLTLKTVNQHESTTKRESLLTISNFSSITSNDSQNVRTMDSTIIFTEEEISKGGTNTPDSSEEMPNKETINKEIFDEEETLQKQNSTETDTVIKTREDIIQKTLSEGEVSNLSLAPCILTIGGLAAGLTGLLAWKRWYIDHNIKWFFVMSSLSTITSVVALIMSSITMLSVYKSLAIISTFKIDKTPNLRFVLTLNVFITCILEFIWSIMSTKVAYKGMRNAYPDDIILSRSRGKIEVNTVHKGNKKAKGTPPDILNHFKAPGKFAKYLPKKKEVGGLPKAESNLEYQERVRKFLSSDVDSESTK